MKPEEVALKFAEAINRLDPDGLADLMTEDHLFVDGMGNTDQGRDRMRDGWAGYYDMVPDYKIVVTETFVSGSTVAMFGTAGGTYAADEELKPENYWSVPAAWKAIIEGDKVKQWQVYADNEPIREIMRREGTLDT